MRARSISMRLALFLAAALAGAVSAPLPARADEAAEAKALFEPGVADLEAGRFAQACPAIEQSYKLDPRPGTLFTLAECENKRGRLATAIRRYDEYLAAYGALSPDKMAKQGDREKIAREQKAALAARVPELTLALPPNAPPATRVTRDGAVVDQVELGTPVRVDPGDHVVITQAPGGPPTTARITLAAGERRGIALVVAPPSAEAAPPASTVPPGEEPKVEGESKWRLYTGGTLVGLGVVSAVVGAVFSSQVASQQGVIDAKRKLTSELPSYDWCSSTNTATNGLGGACSKIFLFQDAQLVAYGLAPVLAGVGAYFLVTHYRQPAAPAAGRLVVVPTAGPRYTGVDATLRF
jgi:hypothetical protein